MEHWRWGLPGPGRGRGRREAQPILGEVRRRYIALLGRVGPAGTARYLLAELTGAPEVTLRVHGQEIRLRPGGPDLRVAIDSLGRELEPLAGLLDPRFDGLIVDAGGYIGTAALKLAAMFPAATIVSIEPSERNFALLRRNTGGTANVAPIQAALVPVSGAPVELRDRGTGDWGFTIVETPRDWADAPALGRVETISLADIALRFPGRTIGLLKLDIEGGEKALFEANPAELAAIPVIFAELHDRIAEGCVAAFEIFSRGRTVRNFGGEKYLAVSDSRAGPAAEA